MDSTRTIERILAARRPPEGDPLAVLGTCRDVVVYGAGSVGRDVARLLARHGRTPLAFLDANARDGQQLDGLTVHRFDGRLPSGWEPGKIAVVIAIFNFAVEIGAVERRLREAGLGRVVNFLELHRHFPEELGDRYWLTDLRFYDDKAADLARTYDLLADDRSRELMLALLRFRCSGDYGEVAVPDGLPQYFGAGAPPLREPVRLIDGGAFDGDTVRALFAATRAVEAVACFEPDPGNYRKLIECGESLRRESAAPIAMLPLGLWSSGAQLRFRSDGGTSSGVSDAGDQVVQCVRIDDALPGFRPTLIKMDIEGAEMEALLGAQRTIREARPDLAICAYHRPDHLWSVPLLLDGWGLGYRMTLRVHCHAGFELVLYAQAS